MDTYVLSSTVPNLTGRVAKTEEHPFAHGGSSDIWKGRLESGSEIIEVAIKVVKGDQDTVTRNRLLRELRVLATLHHPNISPFYGVSFDFDRHHMPSLVFPYYRHGDILRYLRSHPNVDKISLIAQVANAVAYMHSVFVVHGDIKGLNILINHKREASLIDFGVARILQTSGFTTKTSQATWRYFAPEMMNSDDDIIQRVTTETDVYAFSMTVIEILTGRVPFSHIQNDVRVILIVTNGGRPQRAHCPQITNDIWKVLERCWDADPNRRPSMAAVAQFFESKSASLTAPLAGC